VLLAKGGGDFHDPLEFAVGRSPRGVAVADFDGDGIADLAVVNHDSQSVSVLLAPGKSLHEPLTVYAGAAGPLALVAADFDDDGRPDLAIANEISDTVNIFLNTSK
jgi:hypothetical protein